VDISEGLCAGLNAGRSHIGDVPGEALQAALPRFRATTDYAAVAEVDAIVICVPTPLRKSKDPDISHILAASRALCAHARPGQLIVLESTTYPGTTEEVLVPLLEERGLRAGEDVAVAFSPERVDPGNARFGIRNTPKVVGGLSPSCTAAAAALYGRCCDKVVEVSSPATAEMVKLLENSFRSVNIGLVNEFALICRKLGVDVWEVVEAAATKPFGFMPFRPGPGLGGHCIPVDPLYLAWKVRAHNFNARFIELADAINSRMPEHVIDVLTEALNDDALAVRGSRVVVLGVAYKADVADVRESPALEVLALLLQRGARVTYCDPYIPRLQVGLGSLESEEPSDELLVDADAVLIITDHRCVDYARVLRLSRLVVDTRNATAPHRGAGGARVVRL
jgi:UDP-N-acetyl-D-glucosamine dehydrogenase